MNQATMSVKMEPTMTSEARGFVLADADPLFDDGGLQVELHPRGDGGADDADGHVDVGFGRARRCVEAA